ncbi:hypothetical protein SDC9_61279 [bioreactor metagenome]|uniref:Phosphoglycolate phosphatase n=1 Tax=bioreactor metagenome TaxID=1076179 RepID=A0A644XFD2_9ZZZZ
MKILIKHILFDFDGTPVGSLELALQILNGMAVKYHYQKVTMEDMQKLKYMPLTQRFKQIGFPLHKIPAMTMECAAMYKQEISSLEPIEGIRDVIFEYSLSILSSNSVDNITEFLRRNNRLHFSARFPILFCSLYISMIFYKCLPDALQKSLYLSHSNCRCMGLLILSLVIFL